MAEEEPRSLSELPEPILLDIMRQLDATELAALSVQDHRLNHIAGEQWLWEALALCRWPNSTAVHHSGDWRQLYRCRACLPPGYINCVDRCHCLTARAAGKQLRINNSSLPAAMSSPNNSPVKSNVYGLPQQRSFIPIPIMLLEQVMHMLFSLCLLAARPPSGSSSPTSSSSSSSNNASAFGLPQSAAFSHELRLVKEDMAWWLTSKPEELVKFVKRTCDSLSSWDMWGSGFSHWPDVMWRRSALQFMMDLRLGLEEGVCPSVTDKLNRELDRLDDTIRSVNAEGSCLEVPRPAGLPQQHWWYWLTGQGAGPVC